MLNLKINHTPRDVKVLTDQLIAGIDGLNDKMPITGTVTFATGAASTVVTNAKVTPTSVVVLSPKHVNAQGVTYYYTAGTGQFTVFHANNATANRTFGYAVF
ncbi:hypothetical protein [Rhizobium mongolense]|uniref:Uncharacterized protein n=2 Tax=Rhizobium mongolense TaxID=57676 RepID=A0ABR6IQ65_9HYPH|nr:hypothetical protein [Rhizobium mongolense]MBB4230027.1 hypothetical protein [Rhizobium mongolense]TVZ72841.1 hypothetical protein BCL32_1028 [Rhizobium mongolense USDA 1844]